MKTLSNQFVLILKVVDVSRTWTIHQKTSKTWSHEEMWHTKSSDDINFKYNDFLNYCTLLFQFVCHHCHNKYKVNIFVDPTLDEATYNNILSVISSTMNKVSNFGIPTSKFKSFLKPFWTLRLTPLRKNRNCIHTIWKQACKPKGNNQVWLDLKEAKWLYHAEFRCAERGYGDKWEQDIKESQCVDHLVRKFRKSQTTEVDPY